jgi:hypothetical protein
MNDLTDNNIIDTSALNSGNFTQTDGIDDQIKRLTAEKARQQARTWSFYEKLKKENKAEYLEPKVQRQMNLDAVALGDKFFDGDFWK